MTTIEHYRGEHQTDRHVRHPDMFGTHEQNKAEIRQEVFNRMCDRPGNAYCEYGSLTKKFGEHGFMRIGNGEEDFKVLFEHSNNTRHGWVGTSRMKYDIQVDMSSL